MKRKQLALSSFKFGFWSLINNELMMYVEFFLASFKLMNRHFQKTKPCWSDGDKLFCTRNAKDKTNQRTHTHTQTESKVTKNKKMKQKSFQFATIDDVKWYCITGWSTLFGQIYMFRWFRAHKICFNDFVVRPISEPTAKSWKSTTHLLQNDEEKEVEKCLNNH